MAPVPDQAAEAHFDLCIGNGDMRLKLAEATLVLSDEGISYTLDERSGLRPYAQLRSVRLQALPGGKNSPWEAMIELAFERGKPLHVQSSAPWGGDDPKRDTDFIAFVEELHRRIPTDDAKRIKFLRGISEGRHQFMFAVWIIFLLIFGGAGLFILVKTLGGTIPFFEALGPLAGLVAFGIWIYRAVEKNRPGQYQPQQLPRELYPEKA
jgi:hypothetical protein